ncbi:nicotinamide-nucleotide amidase [Crenobacter sp. SG2303]|uniref:Nicotinamide-nucleotide amidase n=1 Tax=Crenobacter oryzisoli TaxID=3056844 RepID=A0ABT7XIM5_9NEIS|nr:MULTISPECIES: nicotinamide-nucleotide amidase [unclassified Crenobacter]MDN0073595.1 nicotinamide-nucleotide amidase [Crenobacter sp. SG2303]MDN0082922.1 nicotinamide-nucleotide amidase [Crenobacter sp. SG2305]
MSSLAEQLGAKLLARGERVTAAESCTGGLIAGAITDVAGSSNWFDMGFVSYSNAAKQQLLGVEAVTLAEHGAVSEATVREMAAGALRAARADWAVAVSGVAGPGGGSAEKPVGLVWFGIAGPAGLTRAFERHFNGDRAAVRRQTVEAALLALLAEIDAMPLMA